LISAVIQEEGNERSLEWPLNDDGSVECNHILEDGEYPVKDNELCDREFYVNVAVMNAAKDSLTSIGISTPSQLHNSTNPTCLSGLNPIKLL
jgi:hypothetical protein